MRALSKSSRLLPLGRTLTAHPNIVFWMYFLTLNVWLFLPSYLFSIDSSTFLPALPNPGHDLALLTRQLFAWRNNLDLFRLNAELTLLISLWVFLSRSRRHHFRSIFLMGLTAIYFITLAYAFYESLTIYIYQVDAVFYAQIRLLIDGLGFLLHHLHVPSLLIASSVITIVAITAFLFVGIRIISNEEIVSNLSYWSRLLLGILMMFTLSSVLLNGNMLGSPKSVVSSQIAKLLNNFSDSFDLIREVRALYELEYPQVYDYEGHYLLTKPNIYLIFIESYGSILYKREAFREPYLDLLVEKQKSLQEAGWFASSTFSESTSWGGGSWMAYTSVLFGLRVDNHPQYLSLVDRFQDQDYPDLGFTLRSLGYRYIRTTSLSVELDDREWQKYINFFGVDEWIRYRDLGYEGMHYGWGPSPPDQFVLNKTSEIIRGQSRQPFFLFLITQNSHYPWQEVPSLVDDWHTLDDGNAVVTLFEESMPQNVKQENYMNAITYELDFLTDFILERAEDEDIFILIGDHQPGYVSRKQDGFDTPLHIISKDQEFVEAFAEYGFVPGLKIEDNKKSIQHEGFYSLFMRIFLQHYGQGTKTVPPYLPKGIELSK